MQWKQCCKMLLLVYSSVMVLVASSSVLAQTESRKAAEMVFSQAVHLFEQGDFEGALERFDIGMRINDKDSAAHYFLAQTYEQMGDRAKALEHYRLSAEYGPQTEYGIISKAVVEREDEKLKQQREQEQQAAQAADFPVTAVADPCRQFYDNYLENKRRYESAQGEHFRAAAQNMLNGYNVCKRRQLKAVQDAARE